MPRQSSGRSTVRFVARSDLGHRSETGAQQPRPIIWRRSRVDGRDEPTEPFADETRDGLRRPVALDGRDPVSLATTWTGPHGLAAVAMRAITSALDPGFVMPRQYRR